ncbi:urate hydroxylase PuuD [Sandaracinobacteroides saxicola]|uniref:Urate hydroxylase PuuD n=1 Tax=Sandaracinobacteroides saxicola TaxID=2759707 RepID=A0A7G5IH03_9SPHN|nr:urate hydroxylase PuuD [Sandaracinobacteroides saxicola]QMW22645.1 urate hydroxylase PuuD [Sandaracinobacteroides saxicola]
MSKILGNLNTAILIGVLLLVSAMVVFHGDQFGGAYLAPWFVFFHVISGVLWIGLLYYFNLVQIPTMPKVPAELKPGVSKYIAPEALFWFRWAAIATLLTGLIVAHLKGYLIEALTFQDGFKVIGFGMYVGMVMAFNVWVFIWPNQKKALGIVDATPEAKAAAATTAMMFSRTNFILSMPMLYAMVTQMYLAV